MKLSTAQIDQVLGQIEAQAVPENHPNSQELEQVFGPHTFLIGPGGLQVIEPTDPADEVEKDAVVVRVAQWVDAEQSGLAPHEPQIVDTINLDGDDSDSAA